MGELGSDVQALPRAHLCLFTGRTVGPGVCGLRVSPIPFLFTAWGTCHTSPGETEAGALPTPGRTQVTGDGAAGHPSDCRVAEPEQMSLSSKCEKLNQTKGNNTLLVASSEPWVIMLKIEA